MVMRNRCVLSQVPLWPGYIIPSVVNSARQHKMDWMNFRTKKENKNRFKNSKLSSPKSPFLEEANAIYEIQTESRTLVTKQLVPPHTCSKGHHPLLPNPRRHWESRWSSWTAPLSGHSPHRRTRYMEVCKREHDTVFHISQGSRPHLLHLACALMYTSIFTHTQKKPI